ncbi:TetR/AcrR family transcriptional regulator C-terminal domain-containing protein [Secundilactobacillus kimchicus]|uniref:TetR/AcrR family transcriptional regulator C-terminal domain-containing protein n=1 Tax=Secundilactobacillus kimchicus TaxID=528209 RepID=UPI0024A7FB54|nr:TetR/AcrR family transcriptional regulator C-terminal domain-containing protein [Secundilactobacillus kimchicus]
MRSAQTRQRLAEALKECMTTTDLKKITIEMIVEKAKVIRTTFYYHFGDVHYLLAWIFDQNIVDQLQQSAENSRWQDDYQLMLDYVAEHRQFCLACFHSADRQLLINFLWTLAKQLIRKTVSEVKQHPDKEVEEAVADFLGGALVMQIEQWLTDELTTNQAVLMRRAEIVMAGTVHRIIRRKRQPS